MPSLVLLGHKTFVAGDDLRCFTTIAMLLRIVQVCVLIPITVFSADHSVEIDYACGLSVRRPRLVQGSRPIYLSYISLSYVMALVGIGIEIGIWRATRKGTPTQPELRWRLKPLCFFKIVPMSCFRACNVCLGILTVISLREYCGCGTSDFSLKCPYYIERQTLFSCLIATHCIEAFYVSLYTIYFGCKSTPQLPSVFSEQTKWRICCRCCCTISSLLTCCLFGGLGGRESDFANVALVLADFFDRGGLVDVVITDIIVGFRMVSRVQMERLLECRSEVIKYCSIKLLQSKKEETDEEMGVEQDADQDENVASEQHRDNVEISIDEVHECRSDDSDDIDASLAKSVLYNAKFYSAVSSLDETTRSALSLLDNTPTEEVSSRSVVYQMTRKDGHVDFRPTQRVVLSRRNHEDKIAIAEGARFMRYAKGVYDMTKSLAKNEIRLKNLLCKDAEVVGTRFQHHLLKRAGLDECELVHARFLEGYAETPYSVVIDHAWKSVVVTIRGTLSLDDVVADLTMNPTSLEEWGSRCGFDGRDCYVHSGMLRCTEYIYNDLEKHGWLDKLLLREDSHVAGYQLRLTGHSLGAGCASILSFMLKSKFPTLRCHAFSPPGCTMSENMADSCKDYLTSYVLDTDIVPRLSLDSMEHLRDDVLEMVARIKVTKQQATNAKPDAKVDELLHQKESIPPSKFQGELQQFYAHREKVRKERTVLRTPLYPPGNIVQLVKTREDEPSSGCLCYGDLGSNLKEKLPYAARWAKRHDLAEVIISSHFLDDHKSSNVLEELERVAELFGLSNPFNIDSTS